MQADKVKAENLYEIADDPDDMLSEYQRQRLVSLLDSENTCARRSAARALASESITHRPATAVAPLIGLLEDDHRLVRFRAANSLREIGGEDPSLVSEAINPLIEALEDGGSLGSGKSHHLRSERLELKIHLW